jgi:HlyD family secretion protein
MTRQELGAKLQAIFVKLSEKTATLFVLPKTEPDPLDFAPPLLRLQESMPNPLGRAVLKALAILLGLLLLWALIGKLDIVAVAEGKLVPQSYLKIVQPSEAGIVKEILVREGQAVKEGQPLMRMDTLIADADAHSIEAEYHRKRLTLRRIDAELANKPFQVESGDPSELAKEIEAQYRANRAALESALAEEKSRLVKAKFDLSSAEQVKAKLSATLPHYQEQEKAYDKLVERGFVGGIMASDKRRERIEKEQELKSQEFMVESTRAGILQSERKLQQIDSDYRRQLHAERNEAQNAYDKLAQEFAKQTHKQELLELKAPHDSIVKDIATHTAGTVVQPGTVLVTLVPQQETLRAEVWVSNEDIGFVREGQTVKVKLVAFPFQKYGMIEGKVEHVSADAADANTGNGNTPAPDKSGKAPPPLYKALIGLKSMTLDADGERFNLTAGMQANAEILLGTRTVMEYLLSPVRKAWHEAARER